MADSNIFRGVNSIKFNQRFKDDNDCLDYLSQIKWRLVLFAKDVKTINFVMKKTHIIEDVPSVDTMKVQQQELCWKS